MDTTDRQIVVVAINHFVLFLVTTRCVKLIAIISKEYACI